MSSRIATWSSMSLCRTRLNRLQLALPSTPRAWRSILSPRQNVRLGRRVLSKDKEAAFNRYFSTTLRTRTDAHEYSPEQPSDISLRPLFIALGICVGSFCIADFLDGRSDARFFRASPSISSWSDGKRVAQMKAHIEIAEVNQTLAWLERCHVPKIVKQSYGQFKIFWLNRNDGERATLILIAANTAVFLAWSLASRSPGLMQRMKRSFIDFPGRNPSYTLLTAAFSHQSFAHFGFNILALFSFGPNAFGYLKSQRSYGYPNIDDYEVINIDSTYHFIAFFMTCGVISNLIPHYITLLATRSQTLMKSSASAALIPRPGLGASGAIYSCVAINALASPDSQIALIFLPMFPIAIGYGFPALALVDAIGVVRGWHRFGHLAHLSGAAVGVAAYQYGPAAWYWGQRVLRGGRSPMKSAKK